VGVHAHRVADLAAQQPPHRLTDGLAEDVPEGVFDSADRGRADDSEPVVTVFIQHPEDLFDVARVPSEDQGGEVFDRADHGPGLPVQTGLTPTVETVLVGPDLDQDPVPHLGVDDRRLDGSDADG
jgi:hypothetical protein